MNKINWFFIQWYFLIVNSTPVPDVTIVLQKISYGTAYDITSVLTGEHLNSGIAWIRPFSIGAEGAKTQVSKYVPDFQEDHNCKIDSDAYCTTYWTNKNSWKLHNSHFTNLDIVTDNRWEEFKILYTDGETKFYRVDEFVNHKNKLTLHFSIRIEKEAHIFLCDETYPPTSKCYWILLGGYAGTQVALRKCMEHQINYYFVAPQGSCAKYQESIKVFPEEYFSMDSWKHFTISINENNIVLKSSSPDYTLLNYTDNKNNYIKIRYLHVRSTQVPAYWKFHTYEFTYTTDVTQEVLGPRIKIQDNRSCISFYAAMCLQCSLVIDTLSIQDNEGSVISTKKVLPLKEFKWQEVKWSTSYPITISDIQLYIHTKCDNNCDGQFWAIDHFRVCTDDEVRVLNVEGNTLQSSFQIVDSTFRNLQIRTPTSSPRGAAQFPDAKCPIGSIGSTNCTSCAQVFGYKRPFCDKSIICDYSYNEEGFCRCSPGYTGVACENACSRTFYGYDCKESCGLCEYPPCNYITGECPIKSCLSKFTDPQCKTPPYPVLRNPPIVSSTGYTDITIEIGNSSYYGMGKPATYKVLYELTNDNNILYETELYDFYHTSQITLVNLHSDTSYTIYIVLVTEENKFYNGSLVPKTVAKTTCIDIQQEDILVNSTNSSAILTFRDKLELCPLKDYEVRLDTKILYYDDNNQFHIPNLNPYQGYTLNIRNLKTATVIYHTFRTKEGIPSTVSSLRTLAFTSTTLTISWEDPVQPNGQIRYYLINYKHQRHLACSDNEDNNENALTLQSFSTNITLENLIPFSEYYIDIAAVTIAAGELSVIRGYTTSTDTLDENEIPKNVSVKLSSTEAKITLEQAKCSFLKGDIDYYISARCISDWCLNKISTLNSTYYSSRQELTITGLLPYTMYTMDIKVARKNGNYEQELFPQTFRTPPTAPSILEFVIYEESEDMLRLRIDPEYPPTGELDQYFVRYCIFSNSRYINCIEKYFEPVSCKIWKNYNCIDISENLRSRTLYRVFIQARNKNVTQLGVVDYHTETTAQRNSYAPEELSYSWDNFYNLTLQWNHPNITNGPLTKFIITIAKDNRKNCYRYDYMVTEENTTLTYNYKVPIEDNDCYTSLLTATIQSFNVRAGGSTDLNIYSPPEMPTLNSEPFVEYVSNTSFTLSPLSAKKTMLQKSSMYIVLSESKSKFEIEDFEDSLYKLENLKTLSPSRLIAKYNLNEEMPLEKLTIGSNKSSDSLQDDAASNRITLSPNTSYTITILMYNEYQEKKRYRVYKIVRSTSGTTISSNDSSNLALLALILVFLLPLLLWIYIRKRKTGKWCSIINRAPSMQRIRGNPDVIPLTKSLGVSTTQIIAPPQIPLKNISNNLNVNKVEDNKINNEYSKPIKVTDFDKYVKDAIINGELERQHALFVRGQTKPWDYGALPQNKSKNRYNNLVAYDHTRVQLEKINNDPYSDYINANYIEGYKTKKAYIATQGPKVATINDFWRMIWQDNVKYILMLANVVEGGKKKTEQYWPNINETSQYGNISVKYISTVVSADYEHRTFLITSNNTDRKIEQLHFTSWPDHGVPMYSQSLVPLFRKLLTIPQGNSPIVVHCSAGVGRTGTVILCDLCLRMSAHEGVIDVLKHQHKIREQRANLVDNLEQYKLAHLVLLECLINPDTNITCDENAEKNILKLLETDKLEKQFQFISEIAWQDQAMRPIMEVDQKSEWKQKNRVEEIFASGYGRVYLSRYPVTDEHSDYINAVEVDGFKAPKRFIATQQPLPNTISDFWRMIDEKEVSTIVSLNSINKENNRSCVFWPTSKISEIQPVPYLLIKFINKIGDEEITIVNLELHNRKNKDHTKRDIKLIKLKDWPADQLIPNANVSLLKLWNETEKVSKSKHPIVVTCHEGATACGLFLALTFVIEKIKLEHQCDVCLAVRTVRHNREQFVQELEQFNYLYRAAITYLSCFELYANFS